jgi:hypothetical protein
MGISHPAYPANLGISHLTYPANFLNSAQGPLGTFRVIVAYSLGFTYLECTAPRPVGCLEPWC